MVDSATSLFILNLFSHSLSVTVQDRITKPQEGQAILLYVDLFNLAEVFVP